MPLSRPVVLSAAPLARYLERALCVCDGVGLLFHPDHTHPRNFAVSDISSAYGSSV